MKFSLLLVSLACLIYSCQKTTGQNPPAPVANISSLNCASATGANGTAGVSYSGTITVPYTGGNSATYTGSSGIPSSHITGLTAVLQSGTLSNGNGNLVFTVSGTPSAPGIAVFPITFAGKSCSIELTINEAPLVQYGTPFAGVADRQDVTMYQVNMRVFSSAGNFQGVLARLDSIKALGANVIYLMPVFPVGTLNAFNSPYCVKDYKSVNPEFGSLADLRAVVDGAHARNMSVILDWVANHTSWDHSWITTHSDWYLKNASGAIVSPPGMGWNDVAQLNFNNAAMRLEMIRSMKYWIYAANVDGFRMDYSDGPPFDFWKQAIDTLRNISTHKLLLLAEGNRSDHFTAGFDFNFGFSFYGKMKNIFNNNHPASDIDGLNTSEYTNSSNGQQVVRYITNHDVNGSDGTPQSIFGNMQGAVSAFVIASTMKSVPMIYNGQEVGTPFPLVFPFTAADINWSLNPELTAEYKKIISFRNNSQAIRRGTVTSYSNADVCAFTKISGAEKAFVAVNTRNVNITYTLPASVANLTWVNAMTGASISLGTQINLAPYSFLVLKN